MKSIAADDMVSFTRLAHLLIHVRLTQDSDDRPTSMHSTHEDFFRHTVIAKYDLMLCNPVLLPLVGKSAGVEGVVDTLRPAAICAANA